jgi:hypothetical protein
MVIVGFILMFKNPELLKKRLKAKETDKGWRRFIRKRTSWL